MTIQPATVRRRLVVLVCFALGLVLLSPLFWLLYRVMVFDTVPRDDYAPYLLWLLGQKGGVLPGSPYVYRLLSAAAAAPFYLLLPVLRVSSLPAGLSVEWVRATAAFAALAYTTAVAAAFVTARTARRLGLAPGESALAGVLLFALCSFSQIFGIDTLAILGVAALLAVLRRPRWFVPGVLASIVVNEKICMVFALWLAIRWALCPADRAVLRVAALASLGALAAYLLMVALVHVPGNSYQLHPTGYLGTIRANLAVMVSARGVILNLLPSLVLVGVAVAGWPAAGLGGMFRRVDLLVIPALILLALTVTHEFQVGRLVMHAAPLFVIPAVAAGRSWHAQAERFIAAGDCRAVLSAGEGPAAFRPDGAA